MKFQRSEAEESDKGAEKKRPAENIVNSNENEASEQPLGAPGEPVETQGSGKERTWSLEGSQKAALGAPRGSKIELWPARDARFEKSLKF